MRRVDGVEAAAAIAATPTLSVRLLDSVGAERGRRNAAVAAIAKESHHVITQGQEEGLWALGA